MRVLIIQQADSANPGVEQDLIRAGIACESAHAAEQVAGLLERGTFGLIVVDRGLPVEQSRAVFDQLRTAGGAAAILWMEAAEEPAQLLRRIRSAPLAGQDPTQVSVDDLVVDFLSGRAKRAGCTLDLTPTEFSILRHLAVNLGQPVRRADMLASLWGIDFHTGTNVVDVHIRRLRAKLDEPFGRPLIHTVRGSGYLLAHRAEAPAKEHVAGR